jgi:hypothetical protein
MNEEQKYVTPIEELDKIIEQIDMGIEPMMTDQMSLEVKLRYKELQNELFDEDDSNDVDVQRHREMMKEHIAKKKREATKQDVLIISLSDEQKRKLRADMETSIVRSNPNIQYNIPDEKLYSSEELRIVRQKLSRIKNCYYNQIDYINAVSIVREAIDYSLRSDYPWMSREEAVKAFNSGEIKFSYCNMPKLFINYQTQITDPEILKGIVTGDVILKDKNDTAEFKSKKNEKCNPINAEYNITGDTEYNEMLSLHKQGYDTPMSVVIKSKSTVYNRYALPSSNRFAIGNNKDNINDKSILFDWSKPGAGKDYYNFIHNKKYQVSEIIHDINDDNDGLLNNIVSTNAIQFLGSMTNDPNKYTNSYNDNNFISTSLHVNQEAAQVEHDILNAIRANNPTK